MNADPATPMIAYSHRSAGSPTVPGAWRVCALDMPTASQPGAGSAVSGVLDRELRAHGDLRGTSGRRDLAVGSHGPRVEPGAVSHPGDDDREHPPERRAAKRQALADAPLRSGREPRRPR